MFTTINNLQVHYIKLGSGPFIFLLHGWGSNLELFRSLINIISTKYTAVALDFPGFGRSEEPSEPWGVSDYTQFFKDFVRFIVKDSANMDEITLLGHSFGGRVIIKLMGSDPNLASDSQMGSDPNSDLSLRGLRAERSRTKQSIKQIILVDSAGIKPKQSIRTRLKIAGYKAGKSMLNSSLIRAISPEAYANFTANKGSADYQAASEVMRTTLVKVVNEDLTPLLPSISVPTLLIWGRDDTATPLKDGELMEQLVPGAGLAVIENAGHYSWLDQPRQFGAIIRSFLHI